MDIMNDPLDHIYWRDEILQILYWFRGEGLGEAVTPAELVTFLGAEEALVQQHLERLAGEGYVTRLEGVPPRYRLTEWGVKEGSRRFADEFAGLTGQAHGECNNPNCSCQTLGPEACAARTPHVH
jgi:DNA-binding transcriptional ArsR family regulator